MILGWCLPVEKIVLYLKNLAGISQFFNMKIFEFLPFFPNIFRYLHLPLMGWCLPLKRIILYLKFVAGISQFFCMKIFKFLSIFSDIYISLWWDGVCQFEGIVFTLVASCKPPPSFFHRAKYLGGNIWSKLVGWKLFVENSWVKIAGKNLSMKKDQKKIQGASYNPPTSFFYRAKYLEENIWS